MADFGQSIFCLCVRTAPAPRRTPTPDLLRGTPCGTPCVGILACAAGPFSAGPPKSNPNAHFWWSMALNRDHNSTRRHPGEEKKEVCGRRGRKNWGPPPFGGPRAPTPSFFLKHNKTTEMIGQLSQLQPLFSKIVCVAKIVFSLTNAIAIRCSGGRFRCRQR